jgi:hypothetical protein
MLVGGIAYYQRYPALGIPSRGPDKRSEEEGQQPERHQEAFRITDRLSGGRMVFSRLIRGYPCRATIKGAGT